MISLPASEVIHIQGVSLDGIVGVSPITDMRITLSGELSRMKHGNNFYQNGANLSGLLKLKKSIGSNMVERAKAKELITQDFREQAIGLKNSNSVAVIDEDSDFVQL
ncbi:phage portal protein, partial [Arthrospira platensis SPKY1]|nr:phage portal protein [Arthrospira platensis SPKY1]